MNESVYKLIEIVGSSTESWDKAALSAIKEAEKHLRDLRIAEVKAQDIHLEEGKDPQEYCDEYASKFDALKERDKDKEKKECGGETVIDDTVECLTDAQQQRRLHYVQMQCAHYSGRLISMTYHCERMRDALRDMESLKKSLEEESKSGFQCHDPKTGF